MNDGILHGTGGYFALHYCHLGARRSRIEDGQRNRTTEEKRNKTEKEKMQRLRPVRHPSLFIPVKSSTKRIRTIESKQARREKKMNE